MSATEKKSSLHDLISSLQNEHVMSSPKDMLFTWPLLGAKQGADRTGECVPTRCAGAQPGHRRDPS